MSTSFLSRGNYFAEPGYVTTDVKRGVGRNRAGTRIIALTSDFLIGLRNALEYECGKAADMVMRTAGKSWGRKFAERTDKELSDFYGQPLGEFPLAVFEGCLAEAFSHHGWGRVKLDVTLYDRGLILVSVVNPVYAELAENPTRPTDPLLAGIFAGVFSYFAGRDLDCVQTQCQGCGASDSRFVVTLPERLDKAVEWVEAGTRHQEIVNRLQDAQAK